MDMAHSRFKYSAAVFGYIPKPMKADLVMIRKIDPKRYSESQMVEDALGPHIEKVKAKLGLDFKEPAQGTPGRRRRRAA